MSLVTQAIKDCLWRKAVDAEFNALLHNCTWELIPNSSDIPIICKCVLSIKRNFDGSIYKYKARLLVRSFLQQVGRDCLETFSHVTKLATIHVVLCLALSQNCPLLQLDANNSFLQGTLHEDVYMM